MGFSSVPLIQRRCKAGHKWLGQRQRLALGHRAWNRREAHWITQQKACEAGLNSRGIPLQDYQKQRGTERVEIVQSKKSIKHRRIDVSYKCISPQTSQVQTPPHRPFHWLSNSHRHLSRKDKTSQIQFRIQKKTWMHPIVKTVNTLRKCYQQHNCVVDGQLCN